MYKKKDRNVNPVNTSLPNGVNPGGVSNRNNTDGAHSGKTVARGSRLTPERLQFGIGFLSTNKKQLFIDILYEFEGALAFNDSEMALLDRAIEPLIVIHTVRHSPWQQNNLRVPISMQDEATQHVKEKLSNETLEFPQGPYRSQYFLVAKKNSGEWLLRKQPRS